MNETPSFHRIDYSIRTNKSIERKLVFDKLGELAKVLSLQDYRYLGFGSMWFVDFLMAHRRLGITKMISIEHLESADRAEFNKPYGCVQIERGSSGQVLANLSHEIWATPMVVWLDYDGPFDQDVRGDCEKVLRGAAAGTVLVVTVNADHRTYRGRDHTGPTTTAIQRLKGLLGDAVPVISESSRSIGMAEFPSVLNRAMLNFMTATVRTSGRETEGYPDRFVPLFDLHHADNAQMATVGGAILSWRQMHDLETRTAISAPDIVEGAQQIAETLDLIPITMKEKLALDRLFPCDEGELAGRLAESQVKLSLANAEKYRRLYRHFPMFAETVL